MNEDTRSETREDILLDREKMATELLHIKKHNSYIDKAVVVLDDFKATHLAYIHSNYDFIVKDLIKTFERLVSECVIHEGHRDADKDPGFSYSESTIKATVLDLLKNSARTNAFYVPCAEFIEKTLAANKALNMQLEGCKRKAPPVSDPCEAEEAPEVHGRISFTYKEFAELLEKERAEAAREEHDKLICGIDDDLNTVSFGIGTAIEIDTIREVFELLAKEQANNLEIFSLPAVLKHIIQERNEAVRNLKKPVMTDLPKATILMDAINQQKCKRRHEGSLLDTFNKIVESEAAWRFRVGELARAARGLKGEIAALASLNEAMSKHINITVRFYQTEAFERYLDDMCTGD